MTNWEHELKPDKYQIYRTRGKGWDHRYEVHRNERFTYHYTLTLWGARMWVRQHVRATSKELVEEISG